MSEVPYFYTRNEQKKSRIKLIPSFFLKNQDSELASLEDFREKWSIIYFISKKSGDKSVSYLEA